jgi:phosphohistidine phosphatase
MELLLIRHAIAEARDARRWPDDRERPLSRPGQQRATRAARGLRRLRIKPALLLCSPLKRARQTAAILSLVAHWPRASVCDELAPDQSAQRVLAQLATLSAARVALVGHEPDLSQLLELCLGEHSFTHHIKIKKLAVVGLRFARRPAAGAAQLQWLLPPRMLRALR